MKLLLDTCVSGMVTEHLRSAGHDVLWTGTWKEDPGDEDILARAFSEDRTLVTLDKDFGELAVIKNKPHRGIVRLVELSTIQQAEMCLYIIERYQESLSNGAIVTAHESRIRIRPA